MKVVSSVVRNLRALRRATALVIAVPFVLLAAALHGFIVAPLTEKFYDSKNPRVRRAAYALNAFIPTDIYRLGCRLVNYKVEFSKASTPVVKDKQVWFASNHLAVDDFLIIGSSAIDGTFAGKGDILKSRFLAMFARAGKYIGLRRSREFNDESCGKIINNFNEGYNTIMFPEATTTPGDKVYLMRYPLFTLLLGGKGIHKEKASAVLNKLRSLFGKNPKEDQMKVVTLEKDVVIQPVALRVKEVEGKNAIGNAALRDLYTGADIYKREGVPELKKELFRVWRRLQIKGMTVELTTLPTIDPKNYKKDFKDEAELHAATKAMVNEAALSIASIVNPGQTTFEKAAIPGQPAKPKTVAPAAQ